MHGHGVAQRVHGADGNPRFFGIVPQEVLNHPLLERTPSAGEQIRPRIVADPETAAQEFGRVAPQRLLAAEAIF
jgi:hypothetical protein